MNEMMNTQTMNPNVPENSAAQKMSLYQTVKETGTALLETIEEHPVASAAILVGLYCFGRGIMKNQYMIRIGGNLGFAFDPAAALTMHA